jgi:hypothetical protein
MAGQVFSKEKKAQIKSELEDLLRGYEKPDAADNVDEQLAEIAAAPPLDFDQMNREFEKQAKGITNSMLKYYADLGILDKHEYIKEKQRVDNSSISNILFQLKTIRMAIEKIAEEINQGNTHPRLFEVFGQLQDKLTTVVKTQANYMLFLEDTYRKINGEIDSRTEGEEGGSQTRNLPNKKDYYITAGTKNLMKDLEAEEVTVESTDSRHLTHPSKKTEVMIARGISPELTKDDDSDNFSDELGDLI